MGKKEDNLNKQTVELNFSLPFRDFHLVSQDYIISEAVIETWTLGKLKIPEFTSANEMQDWIITVDFLIKSESYVISGPAYPYYTALNEFYTKQLTIEDRNGNIYQIPERNYYNKKSQPLDLLDTKKLTGYIKEPVDVILPINTYGSCTANEKMDGKYCFKGINMCGLVDFLLNTERTCFSPPKEQQIFSASITDYSSEIDFDECNAYWQFKSIKKSNNLLIIETPINDETKEEQIEYFDSFRMWHEKFIKNNKMYLILFETDGILASNLVSFFKPLIATLKEGEYPINSYSCSIDAYIKSKLKLHEGQIQSLGESLNPKVVFVMSFNMDIDSCEFYVKDIEEEPDQNDIKHFSETITQKTKELFSYVTDNIDKDTVGRLILYFESDPLDKVYSSIDLNTETLADQVYTELSQLKSKNYSDVTIYSSFIMNKSDDLWENDFLNLSNSFDKTIAIYGPSTQYHDIVRQGYDCGEYDTGIFSNDEQSYYILSENLDDFPIKDYFEKDTYLH
jgi:hypothetical protein